MNNVLRITVPVTITDAMLTGTDVPEADHPVWSSVTTYAEGDKVIKDHVIWSSAASSNLNNDPSASGRWIKVSATNRWALFDLEQVTRTTRPGNMYYEVQPGEPVGSLHIFGMKDVDYAQVKVYEGATEVKDYGQNAAGLLPVASDLWTYCYGPWTLSDQQHYTDLPYIVSPRIRVDFAADSQQSVQVLLLGNDTVFGEGQDEGVLGGVDVAFDRSSNFSANDFNIPTMKNSALVSTVNFTLRVKSSRVDDLIDFYRDNGLKVCLFNVSDKWRNTQVLGAITSFKALLHGPIYSEFAFELRGVPQQ